VGYNFKIEYFDNGDMSHHVKNVLMYAEVTVGKHKDRVTGSEISELKLELNIHGFTFLSCYFSLTFLVC
jgi:hypothetical protein